MRPVGTRSVGILVLVTVGAIIALMVAPSQAAPTRPQGTTAFAAPAVPASTPATVIYDCAIPLSPGTTAPMSVTFAGTAPASARPDAATVSATGTSATVTLDGTFIQGLIDGLVKAGFPAPTALNVTLNSIGQQIIGPAAPTKRVSTSLTTANQAPSPAGNAFTASLGDYVVNPSGAVDGDAIQWMPGAASDAAFTLNLDTVPLPIGINGCVPADGVNGPGTNPPSGQVSPAPAPWGITELVAAVNAAPVPQDQSVEVTTNIPKGITLTATDDATVASYGIVTGPSNGTVTVDDAATGAVTYTPNPDFEGSDSFTFDATDNEGKVSEAPGVVTVTVVPPVPPTCTSPVTLTVIAGTSASIDPVPCSGDGFTPSASSVLIGTGPTSGTAAVGSTGAITYTNTDVGATSDSFTFTVTSSSGLTSDPVTVDVAINPPSGPLCTSPVALSVDNGGSASIDPVPCSGEGFTPSVDSIEIGQTPAHGTADVVAGGVVTYTNTDASATADSFTFKATNAAGATSTVAVEVSIAAPSFVTGEATYAETPCTVDLTGDVVPITFAVEGTAPKAVEAGDTITIGQQRWTITVPGALVDGVLPFLAGATSLDQVVTPSVNGTNTDPTTVAAPGVTVPVGPIGAAPNPDLTETFAVADLDFQATGGDAAFQMGPTVVSLALPGGLVVNLACAPAVLPQPWLTVAVSGAPLPPKPPSPPVTTPEVLAAQAVGTSGTLPYTGSDGRALAVQILAGLLLIQVGYLVWSVTRPGLRRRRELP